MTTDAISVLRHWKTEELAGMNRRIQNLNHVYGHLRDECQELSRRVHELSKQSERIDFEIDAARRGCQNPHQIVAATPHATFFAKILSSPEDCDTTVVCKNASLKYPFMILKHIAPFFVPPISSFNGQKDKTLRLEAFTSPCVDAVIKYLAIDQPLNGPLPFLIECYQLLHYLGELKDAEGCFGNIQKIVGNDLDALLALCDLWIWPEERPNPAYVCGFLRLLVNIVGNNQPLLRTIDREASMTLFKLAYAYVDYDISAQIYAALACKWGIGTTVQFDAAFELLRDATIQGSALGQTLWAEFFLQGIHKNVPKAINLLTVAAEDNNSLAKALLGHHLEARDKTVAKRLLTESAAAENSLGEAHLGRMLEIEGNLHDAYVLYTSSADKSDPLGQAYLGLLFGGGIYVERDLPRAFELFSASSRQGNPIGMAKEAAFYNLGVVVPQDTQRARRLFDQALSKSFSNDLGAG